jgi:hypothetical protein
MKEIFGIEKEDFLSEIDKMLVERVREYYSLDRLYGEYYTDFILNDGQWQETAYLVYLVLYLLLLLYYIINFNI